MKVESNVTPSPRELLQGKILVNFNVETESRPEMDGTSRTVYVYEQLRFEPWYSEEAIQKAVDKRKEELRVTSITPRQIRLQLTTLGLRQQVEDWVATQPIDIKDWWEFSTVFERNNQMLIDAATHFGLTSEQLDQLFVEASKL